MTYTLLIGDRSYSSWSLRGWLLIEKFGLNAVIVDVDFLQKNVAEQLEHYAPARTVPTLATSDGAVISETLAIAEELASRHPDAGIWPETQIARAIARTLAAEMASGFAALRTDCPMNLRTAYQGVEPSLDVQSDLRRLETIWAAARAKTSADGPWLCGDYSAADAFFAPIAARIAGYGLTVDAGAQAYVAAHLHDPAFRRWRALGQVTGQTLPWYRRDHEPAPWPGPPPIDAQATENGEPENAICPYSGKPVTHLANIGGRVFGFCNATCRDKTVLDAECWPDFMAIYDN